MVAIKKQQSGKPIQNALIERRNESVRRELLKAYLFYNLNEGREMRWQCRRDCNNERSHKSLSHFEDGRNAGLSSPTIEDIQSN